MRRYFTIGGKWEIPKIAVNGKPRFTVTEKMLNDIATSEYCFCAECICMERDTFCPGCKNCTKLRLELEDFYPLEVIRHYFQSVS